MIALIDGDIVLHRVGYTTDNDSEGIARARVNEMLDGILYATGAAEFDIYLSDSKENNFRYEIYPEYKANRTAPRPIHYQMIKEYLVTDWNARIAIGMEADDALGIHQGENTVICSIDKDLLQIPGKHFNFVREEWYEVDEWEGMKWFYQQLLIGDVTDNVKGCNGIGPVRSGRIIGGVNREKGEQGLFDSVVETYRAQEAKARQKGQEAKTDEEILSQIRLAGRLLKIKQTEDEPLWDFPSLRLTEAQKPVSIQPKQEELTPSTELTKPLECGSQSLGKQTGNIAPASAETSPSVKL